MWCLLMCELNETFASAMEGSAIPLFGKEQEPASHPPELPSFTLSSSPPLRSVATVADESNVHLMLPSSACAVPFLSTPVAEHLKCVPVTSTPSVPPFASTTGNSFLSDPGIIAVSTCSSLQAEMDTNYEELTSEEDLSRILSTISSDICSQEQSDGIGDLNAIEQKEAACLKSDGVEPDKLLSTETDTSVYSGHSCVPIPSEVSSELSVVSGDSCQCSQSEFYSKSLDTSGLIDDSCVANLETLVAGLSFSDSTVPNLEVFPCVEPSVVDSELPPEPLLETSGKQLDQFEIAGVKGEPPENSSSPVNSGSEDEDDSTPTHDRVLLTTPFSDDEIACSADAAAVFGGTLEASKVVQEFRDCSSEETFLTGQGDTEEEKDEKLTKLVQRLKDLETQLQERTEWAKQKVMQAAWRLSKDLQELKALRLEREETQRLKKEKQAFEESTKKKINDLETALRKASSQVDRANASVRKLEGESAEVRAEIEATKLSAAETMASFKEMGKRERNYKKRAQAWEKEKAKLQEDLSEEKRKIAALQQQLSVAKERQQQAEVRWRQEQKSKDDAMLRADDHRRAREVAETAAKKREEALRRKAELSDQRHREDMERVESELAQYRTSAEATQLATSRWGLGVAFTPHVMDSANLHNLAEQNIRLSRELAQMQEMSRRDVHRERECVMCMCEEMSVVFLPCAHQVVCVKCNELHEKQGMRDCPSCRTQIKQRVQVFGISSK